MGDGCAILYIHACKFYYGDKKRKNQEELLFTRRNVIWVHAIRGQESGGGGRGLIVFIVDINFHIIFLHCVYYYCCRHKQQVSAYRLPLSRYIVTVFFVICRTSRRSSVIVVVVTGISASRLVVRSELRMFWWLINIVISY